MIKACGKLLSNIEVGHVSMGGRQKLTSSNMIGVRMVIVAVLETISVKNEHITVKM